MVSRCRSRLTAATIGVCDIAHIDTVKEAHMLLLMH